jgi:hypothetical protein
VLLTQKLNLAPPYIVTDVADEPVLAKHVSCTILKGHTCVYYLPLQVVGFDVTDHHSFIPSQSQYWIEAAGLPLSRSAQDSESQEF